MRLGRIAALPAPRRCRFVGICPHRAGTSFPCFNQGTGQGLHGRDQVPQARSWVTPTASIGRNTVTNLLAAPGTVPVGRKLTRDVAERIASNLWMLLLNGAVLIVSGV